MALCESPNTNQKKKSLLHSLQGMTIANLMGCLGDGSILKNMGQMSDIYSKLIVLGENGFLEDRTIIIIQKRCQLEMSVVSLIVVQCS